MDRDGVRIMDLLKDATAEQHRDAETRRLQKAMVQGRISDAEYGAWLGQMYLVHRALDEALRDALPANPVLGDIVRDEGRHVANLREDLAVLGVHADSVPALPATVRLIESIRTCVRDQPLALLGHNYVLEGSMNGNTYIARALARSLPHASRRYLDPYGDAQRPTWQSYRERMNAADFDAGSAAAMLGAAQEMFAGIAAMSDEIVAVAA